MQVNMNRDTNQDGENQVVLKLYLLDTSHGQLRGQLKLVKDFKYTQRKETGGQQLYEEISSYGAPQLNSKILAGLLFAPVLTKNRHILQQRNACVN